jgi:NADH:ubiquinone oxidoreductase subunit E
LFAYRLAKDLGRTVEEILDMSIIEFAGWATFYKMEAEEMKKAYEKGK